MKKPLSRRSILGGSAGLAGLSLLPFRQAIASAPEGRKFIFIWAGGGWDPTRVFASEFDNPNVDMERDADEVSIGELTYVAHTDRPSVTSFMERFSNKTVFFNGILVPSVAHDNCTRLVMTGSTRQDAADWGAILAGAQGADYALPQVVAAGPSYPGAFGVYVTRTGTQGQLPALLSGDIVSWSDTPVTINGLPAQSRMDSFLRERTAMLAAGATQARDRELKEATSAALTRAGTLKDLLDDLNWSDSGDFAGQIEFAAGLLGLGVSRCVNLQHPTGWDTHSDNDAGQSANFEALFADLNALADALAARPGTAGGVTLLEETVFVVLSEMGRTPRLNGGEGKDHWPFTCAMVMGDGLNGGRVIGGYDLYYYGRRIDLASGEIYDDGTNLDTNVFGATLLTLAGLDSQEYLAGVGVVSGALRA
jgi:uncharacterized protein (DUF1501 family)